MPPPADPAGLALDACGLLNLAGAGVALADVQAAVRLPLVAVEHVVAEALWVEDVVDDEPVQVPVDLGDPAYAGLVVLALDEGEVELFVRLAAEVDDGEAATLAAAQHRGLAVLTDDRKAGRVAGRLGVPVLSTAAVLRLLTVHTGRTDVETGALLRLVERRARFRPRRTDPDHDWWAHHTARPTSST